MRQRKSVYVALKIRKVRKVRKVRERMELELFFNAKFRLKRIFRTRHLSSATWDKYLVCKIEI